MFEFQTVRPVQQLPTPSRALQRTVKCDVLPCIVAVSSWNWPVIDLLSH